MSTANLRQTTMTIWMMKSQPSSMVQISPDWSTICVVAMVPNQQHCTLKMWRSCLLLQITKNWMKNHQPTVHQHHRPRQRRKRRNIAETDTIATSEFNLLCIPIVSVNHVIHWINISNQNHRIHSQKCWRPVQSIGRYATTVEQWCPKELNPWTD